MSQNAREEFLDRNGRRALDAMAGARALLITLGWREAQYAPRDPSKRLLLIEAGSTGVHVGYRDAEGRFWIPDSGDTWPSRPTLYKLAPEGIAYER